MCMVVCGDLCVFLVLKKYQIRLFMNLIIIFG